jgi:hypothetical protein
MTLTIITGTHSFIDLTGKFRDAFIKSMSNRIKYTINGLTFTKRRFDRVEITKEGKVIHEPSRLFPMDRNGLWWSVSQPTGSGKTILAVFDMQRTHQRGGRVEGNLSYQYFPHNKDLPAEKWTPSVRTIEDLQKLRGCHCVIDDIKGTIANWQAKEADIITLTSNTGRKESVDLTFTTQRVINYMPPNIRAVATGYEIPYITVRDCRIPTPDNKGFPVEMEVFSLIPGDNGDIFVGFGVLNKDIPDGRIITPSAELLNSYRTMELATGLKIGGEDGARVNQPGYELEAKALEFLKEHCPGMKWQHLNGKHVFDIISDTHAIDITGTDPDGRLILEHKDLLSHIRTAKRKCQKPYLMYESAGSWRFIPINSNLNEFVEGKRLSPDKFNTNRLRTIDSI